MKEYFINLKNDKNKLWLFEIVSVLVLSLGFTLALKYISKKINTSLVSANINVIYKGDSKITKDLFLPIKENEIEEYGAVANFTVKGAENNVTDNNIVYDITLTDIDITDGLLDENFKFQLLKNDVIIGEGNFSSLQVEKKGEKYKYYQRVILNENVLNLPKYTDTADSFQLRIYILDNGSDQSSLMGQRFRAKVEIATYTTKVFTNRDRYTNLITRSCPKNTVTPVYVDNSGANTPVLAEGMIPVVYDEGLGIWLKADTNAGWFNYNEKIWANAVMVKNDASKESLCSRSRTDYIEAMPFTPIMEEDILAYYVWIPRYKYQLFNAEYKKPIMSDDFITCVDNCLEEQLIEVIFESGTNTTGETRCQVSEIGIETCTNKENGKWYTHPAFTFGDTELEGIWVGKFETSGNATTPTIKPNMTSLTNQNVSTQFITSQKFNSTKYLTKNGTKQTDAHMMKNIEWGAVAYLKQSKYGLGNIDMGMNNYYYCDKYGDAYVSYDKASEYCESPVYHKTGCGDKANREETSFCNAYYTVRGRMASTTGNITGVYDMSGGTDEYVMGVIQDNDTTKRSPMSGYSTIDNSGYIGKAGESYIDSGNTLAFPNLKYYDLYANGSHLGDATGETAGWYKDYVYFVSSDRPWFYRGLNTFNYRQSTGIFAFGAYYGGASDYSTFRSVLSITK